MTNVQVKYDNNSINISETQLKFICDVLEKQDYKDSKITIEPVGKKGDNYAANVVRVTAERNDGKTFKMVAKVASVHEGFRKVMKLEELFINETVMYTVILPKFLELQEKAGVVEDDHIKFAKCYGALSEAPNEVILLEDMSESDFKILSRFESMPNECVRLVLKKLAAIHSMSFVLKNKEPDTYEEFRNKLINIWALLSTSKDGMWAIFEHLSDDIQAVLDNGKYKNIVHEVMSHFQRNSEKLIAYNTNSKHCVIQQGDCWINNIMFKLENGQPLEVCMVDYQVSREASPASDFLQVTFNCTDYENRCKYYAEWVDYYHTQLDESLAHFGLKANFLYPRDQFDADLRRYGKFAMGLSFIVSNVFVRESEESIDLKTNSNEYDNVMEQTSKAFSVKTLNENSILKYKNRIEGLIDSFIEYGYYTY